MGPSSSLKQLRADFVSARRMSLPQLRHVTGIHTGIPVTGIPVTGIPVTGIPVTGIPAFVSRILS
jgi:hypothetical protein